MKPIEKYKEKFIELLKEAEEELGGNLKIEVRSYMRTLPSVYSSYPPVHQAEEKAYDFVISTNNDRSPFLVM